MFEPVWMASPPEVHATALSTGPGPGPLLAAAAAWSALSLEYAQVAEELHAVVGVTAGAAWQGQAALRYDAAHQPYLAWLVRSAAESAHRAAAHESAAAAYVTALAAMPTLPELAANHAAHGVLIATNFFGINTIPIALNEADYLRMWVQAATVMATYQAVSDATLAGTPRAAPAAPIAKAAPISQAEAGPAWWSSQPVTENPLQGLLDYLEPFLKSLGLENGVQGADRISNAMTTVIADFLRNFGIIWDPSAGTINGIGYELYADASQPIWYLARTLELFQDFLAITQDPTQFISAMQYLGALMLFDWPTHIAQLLTAISQSPAMFLAAAGAVVAPAGLAGLAGLAGAPIPAGPAALPATPMVVADVPAVGVGSGVVSAPPPAAPPAPAPAASAPAPAVGAPPAAAPAGVPLFPYLIGAGPGIDHGSGIGAHAAASAGAKKRRSTPESTAAAAATDARRSRRRRRGATRPGHADEQMGLTVEVAPDWEPAPVSVHGAGELGRTHGVTTLGGRAGGLTRIDGTAYADGPRMPLLPEGWDAD
ncbi:PPE domain-containing protein [Mycolicibacter minnesotensis]